MCFYVIVTIFLFLRFALQIVKNGLNAYNIIYRNRGSSNKLQTLYYPWQSKFAVQLFLILKNSNIGAAAPQPLWIISMLMNQI